MAAHVEIAKAQNGTTKVLVNGMDISPYIVHFSLTQKPSETIPTLEITLPVSSVDMPSDFWANLEIRRKGDGENG